MAYVFVSCKNDERILLVIWVSYHEMYAGVVGFIVIDLKKWESQR